MRSILLVVLTFAAGTSAHAASRNYPVGGFDKVKNTAPVDVRVHTGAPPSASASGPQEVLDRLEIGVRNGELVVGMKRGSWFSGWNWKGDGHTVVDVNVPSLAAASLSGPGNLTIDRVRTPAFAASLSGPGDIRVGLLETRNAVLSLSGPGNLTVAGHADLATLSLTGPGDIRAKSFTTRDLTANLSGPGNIDIAATGSATVSLSGPGDVRVSGNPRCTVRKSGPGNVRCG